MESILQSIVKIIIIGSLYESTNVHGNRQFLPPLPPPLPYYQNGEYIPPGFVLPYQEAIPVYYQDDSLPPPISYQNMNSYSPPQLFHQNVNYDPLQAANPGGAFPTPHLLPYKPGFYPPYKPPKGINTGVQQVNHKKSTPTPAGSHERPAEVSPKKPAFYATNIVVKEESHPPYYHDDYSKNYHEEDYNDNYSDDISSPPEPCLTSPYRYFEPAKTNPNNKYSLCTPYFQPNFGNGVYTVKMPITLLPSRFPPRVEELIERIQNYFSTYTQQETPKPQNQTSTSTIVTTVEPVTEAASESETHSTVMMEAQNNKKNTSVEIVELNLEQNAEVPETTVEAVNELEQSTQKTIVVEIEKVETQKEINSDPDALAKKESQMVQSTQSAKEPTENPTVTELFVSRQQEPQGQSTTPVFHPNSVTGNQIMKEWAHGAQTVSPQMHGINMEGLRAAAGTTETRNYLGETSTIQPVFNVTDNTG